MEPLAPRTTHLEARQLEALRRGTLDDVETRRIRSHLAETCAGCARAVAEVLVARYGDLPRPAGPGGPRRVVVSPPSLGAFARHHAEAAAWEEAVAPGLARALEPWEEAEAFQLIGDEPAYRTHALATHLAAECRRVVIADTRRGYHLGRLAVAVAAYAPEERYGSGLCADLKGEAALALANAARCCSRFYEARRMLQMAEEFLGMGTGDVMSQVQLSSTRSSIARDLGYNREALDALYRGRSLLPGSQGGALDLTLRLKIGNVFNQLNPAIGLELHRSTLRSIDRESQPMLDFCARIGIANSLRRVGRTAAAIGWIGSPASHEIGAKSHQHERKFRWLTARTLLALGRVHEATRRIETLLGDHGREEDIIVASAYFDLAAIALVGGKVKKARRLAGESAARFSSMGAERYAMFAASLTTLH
jgi:hypothetical protein